MLANYELNPGEQPPRFVQLDSRGRLSLQRYTNHTTFQLTMKSNGTIVLIPSIVVPAAMEIKDNFEA